jgi:Lecithin:cholesterol acyltransferase
MSPTTDGLVDLRVRPRVSPDAVVVIPGIMGTALTVEGREVWGFRKLGWYARAWRGSALGELRLTDDELAGNYGRVRAPCLLRAPAFAPFLHGLKPYAKLTQGVRRVVADDAAVLEFPYDWRLPIAYNAGQLAVAARNHLKSWRAHPAYQQFRREFPDSEESRLVLVAHSMGGLLVRALPRDLDVRAVVTLGTPWDGAPKSLVVLNSGREAPIPLPGRKMRDLVATMPGFHDLLPTFRCVDDREHDGDPRRLSPADIAAVGGDAYLASASQAFHRETAAATIPGHLALVGTGQPTIQSVSFRDGVIQPHQYSFRPMAEGFQRDRDGVLLRIDALGDGTVPLNSALPHRYQRPATLPQQHQPLVATVEGINAVCEVILGQDPHAPRLGGGELGLEVPDIVAPGIEWTARVVGDDPHEARLTVHGENPAWVQRATIRRRDGEWSAAITVSEPGIHEVRLAGAGTSVVTQMIMVDPGCER